MRQRHQFKPEGVDGLEARRVLSAAGVVTAAQIGVAHDHHIGDHSHTSDHHDKTGDHHDAGHVHK